MHNFSWGVFDHPWTKKHMWEQNIPTYWKTDRNLFNFTLLKNQVIGWNKFGFKKSYFFKLMPRVKIKNLTCSQFSFEQFCFNLGHFKINITGGNNKDSWKRWGNLRYFDCSRETHKTHFLKLFHPFTSYFTLLDAYNKQ